MPRSGSEFAPTGFFGIRVPLLSFDEFVDWAGDLDWSSVTGPERVRMFDRERSRLRARLHEVISRPEVVEALLVAAPSLLDSISAWRANPSTERGRRVERALVRYFSRMCGRATPFGLFAAFGTGVFAPQSNLRVPGSSGFRKSARLDGVALTTIVRLLERDPEIRRALLFYPNTTMYRVAGQVKFAAMKVGPRATLHELVAISADEYLDALLEHAQNGATRETLIHTLKALGAPIDECREYVDDAIDSQVLISELTPAATGPEPGARLLEALRLRAPRHPATEMVGSIIASLSAVSDSAIGNPPQRYEAVERLVRQLAPRLDRTQLLQVDCTLRSDDITLNSRVALELARAMELVRTLNSSVRHPTLDRFRADFHARYGDREVPLAEALDSDLGVGFDPGDEGTQQQSDLLTGLRFGLRSEPPAPMWRRSEALMLQKILDAREHGLHEVEITPRDAQTLASSLDTPQLPDAFAVLATVVAADETALDRGDFQIALESFGGPSGARAFGRFCGADPRTLALVTEHLTSEEKLRPNDVFAEVSHLSDGRLGNVVFRPHLRSVEIAYGGSPRASDVERIPLSDLAVHIEGTRIVLRSQSMNKEVIPRFSAAHTFEAWGPPVYRFLGMLQEQGCLANFGWNWGALDRADFLPRVRYGPVILKRARWNVSAEALGLGRTRDDVADFDAVQAFRSSRRLPRYVAIKHEDLVLPLDLDNPLSCDVFTQWVRQNPTTLVVELLPGADRLCVSGPAGRYVHEIVVPFARTVRATTARVTGRSAAITRAQPTVPALIGRVFPPGTRWLYYKFYTGQVASDRVLREHIAPLVKALRRENSLQKWFFIRYRDDAWHLRLRLSVDESADRDVRRRIESLGASLVQRGVCWRIQADTYEREIERYGGPRLMEACEELFCADSDAVLQLLEDCEDLDGRDSRWRVAMLGARAILDDCGLSVRQQVGLLKGDQVTFPAAAAAKDAPPGRDLGANYRRFAATIRDLFENSASDEPTVRTARDIFAKRSIVFRHVLEVAAAPDSCQVLAARTPGMVSSLVHMHLNRMLRRAHRQTEIVLRDHLASHLWSAMNQAAGRAAAEDLPDESRVVSQRP